MCQQKSIVSISLVNNLKSEANVSIFSDKTKRDKKLILSLLNFKVYQPNLHTINRCKR